MNTYIILVNVAPPIGIKHFLISLVIVKVIREIHIAYEGTN